jgi:S1-C subfamily serine protease
VTPLEHGPHSRIFIPLLIAVLGIAIGGGVAIALQPLASASPARQAAGAAAASAAAASAAAASAAAADKPAGRSTARTRALSDRAIYARVEPSVVDVTATLRSADETASGTGIVINTRAALVLTNNHVIRGATSVIVTIPGTGRTYQARIVGTDSAADIAVLQVSPVPGLAAAPLGDSATMTVGAAVVVIGNLAGAGGSPAAAPGVISGTGRTIRATDSATGFTETLQGLLATTARIEPGDSGGPLADAAGAVIGVDTAAGTGGDAAGYAIPIDDAMAAERQILADARGRHDSPARSG